MANNITPFVKRMRTQGGTFYTFSSAVEDIGININEKNNFVEMSNFALLDIPPISSNTDGNLQQNRFNVFAIPGGLENQSLSSNIKDGRIVIAESFQNYALNLESTLLNQNTYNPALLKTVSERVLWKWLKETGAIRWVKDTNNVGYFKEEIDTNDPSVGYVSLVKYIGQISAGSVRTDNFGTYNETYVLVPTSHGQTDAFFKQQYDDNYKSNMSIGPNGENILGRENYTSPHPDGLSLLGQYDHMTSDTMLDDWSVITNGIPGTWCTVQGKVFTDDYYYATDDVNILDSSLNFKVEYTGLGDFAFQRSNVDALELEFNMNTLKTLYGDSTLSFDKMAIEYSLDDSFEFNAVLVYYSVYNKAKDKKLATNLLGILFLDTPSGNTSSFPDMYISIPTLDKLQSTDSGFGSSYSFRINIKSDNMMDDTQAVIIDESTSAQTSLENWTDVLSALGKSVSILNQNTYTINYITDQYMNISSIQTQQADIISDLQYQVNDVATDIKGTNNTIALFADGDDPLVDSSIYMRFGKIGMFNNDPKYDVHINGNVKTKDIYLEKAIRDTSGNILLSYGSPLTIGSTTNYRKVDIYTGDSIPNISIDSSIVTINSPLTVDGNLSFSGDISINSSNIYFTNLPEKTTETNVVYFNDSTKELSYGVGGTGGGGGTVTSVGLTAPIGLSVTNSPITYADTINLNYTSGYSIPLDASQNNWQAASNSISTITETGKSLISTPDNLGSPHTMYLTGGNTVDYLIPTDFRTFINAASASDTLKSYSLTNNWITIATGLQIRLYKQDSQLEILLRTTINGYSGTGSVSLSSLGISGVIVSIGSTWEWVDYSILLSVVSINTAGLISYDLSAAPIGQRSFKVQVN